MEIDEWIDNCRVRSFPCIDGKHIYFNVCTYAPGQSIEKPPVLDRTAYITNNSAGREVVQYFTNSLVRYIINTKFSEQITKIVITVQDNPIYDNLFGKAEV